MQDLASCSGLMREVLSNLAADILLSRDQGFIVMNYETINYILSIVRGRHKADRFRVS